MRLRPRRTRAQRGERRAKRREIRHAVKAQLRYDRDLLRQMQEAADRGQGIRALCTAIDGPYASEADLITAGSN